MVLRAMFILQANDFDERQVIFQSKLSRFRVNYLIKISIKVDLMFYCEGLQKLSLHNKYHK